MGETCSYSILVISLLLKIPGSSSAATISTQYEARHTSQDCPFGPSEECLALIPYVRPDARKPLDLIIPIPALHVVVHYFAEYGLSAIWLRHHARYPDDLLCPIPSDFGRWYFGSMYCRLWIFDLDALAATMGQRMSSTSTYKSEYLCQGRPRTIRSFPRFSVVISPKYA
jgi:hypothetical protein